MRFHIFIAGERKRKLLIEPTQSVIFFVSAAQFTNVCLLRGATMDISRGALLNYCLLGVMSDFVQKSLS